MAATMCVEMEPSLCPRMLVPGARFTCGTEASVRACLRTAVHLLMMVASASPVLCEDDTRVSHIILPRVFQDCMVLQQGMPLPIWGTAPPGESITVEFGSVHVTTNADSDGRWMACLPPLQASDRPRTLTISGQTIARIRDILVGEVWVCAGQSNMEWPLSRATAGEVAIETAADDCLRLLHLRGSVRGGSVRYTQSQVARLTPGQFCEGTWSPCRSDTVRDFSAVAYFFGRRLREELDVPVGLICPAIGGTPTEAWMCRDALEADPQLEPLVRGNWLKNDDTDPWCRERAQFNLSQARETGVSIPGDDLGPNHSFKPTFMWRSAIEPIIPFGIRGVIWYQGESNSLSLRRVNQHNRLFPRLIEDWRNRWEQGAFPFLFVQLPAMGTSGGYKSEHWPEFREGQRQVSRAVSNTGMVVAIDVGHATDVHPRDKRPVGERLALWALRTSSHRKELTYSGPLLRSHEAKGSSLVLHFTHVGAGLISKDEKPLRHFELAGEGGVFRDAEAVIAGKTIVLSSKGMQEPRHARYAWSPFPDPPVNFFNRDGLPASPFTTRRAVTSRQGVPAGIAH